MDRIRIAGELVRMAMALTNNRYYNSLMNMAYSSRKNDKLECAKDPSTPKELLAQLALEDDRELLIAVAKNPRTSYDTLEKLMYNDDDMVAGAAMEAMERGSR